MTILIYHEIYQNSGYYGIIVCFSGTIKKIHISPGSGRSQGDRVNRSMYFLGLDIGGTKCRVSLGLDEGGRLEIAARGKERATREHSPAEMPELLREDAERLTEKAGRNPSAIGVNCGGPLGCTQRIILFPPNLPGWFPVFWERRSVITPQSQLPNTHWKQPRELKMSLRGAELRGIKPDFRITREVL
jgi:hypothetical protein